MGSSAAATAEASADARDACPDAASADTSATHAAYGCTYAGPARRDVRAEPRLQRQRLVRGRDLRGMVPAE